MVVNVWRTDMTSVASDSSLAETSFSIRKLLGFKSGCGDTFWKVSSFGPDYDAGKDELTKNMHSDLSVRLAFATRMPVDRRSCHHL